MVGDGHAMGVAAQILKHKLWATEGWFQINDPVCSVQGPQPGGKDVWLSEEGEVSVETELAITEGLLESGDKLSAKDLTQHLARKKVPLGSGYPVGVIERQTAGRNDAMDMRVGRELLTPGMQNAEEADFCTEVFGVAGHFEKSFRTDAKQEIVDDLLVLQDQRGQMTGKREDHMHVRRGEQFLATCCEPAVASPGLTLWAVPVAARVVGDGAMSAAGAFIEMAAERGGATPRNGQEHFDVLPGDPLTASFDECVSRSADQIGHLEEWPVHLLFLR